MHSFECDFFCPHGVCEFIHGWIIFPLSLMFVRFIHSVVYDWSLFVVIAKLCSIVRIHHNGMKTIQPWVGVWVVSSLSLFGTGLQWHSTTHLPVDICTHICWVCTSEWNCWVMGFHVFSVGRITSQLSEVNEFTILQLGRKIQLFTILPACAIFCHFFLLSILVSI